MPLVQSVGRGYRTALSEVRCPHEVGGGRGGLCPLSRPRRRWLARPAATPSLLAGCAGLRVWWAFRAQRERPSACELPRVSQKGCGPAFLARSPDGPTTLYLDGCGTSGERQHRPYRPSLGAAMRGCSPLPPVTTPSSLPGCSSLPCGPSLASCWCSGAVPLWVGVGGCCCAGAVADGDGLVAVGCGGQCQPAPAARAGGQDSETTGW